MCPKIAPEMENCWVHDQLICMLISYMRACIHILSRTHECDLYDAFMLIINFLQNWVTVPYTTASSKHSIITTSMKIVLNLDIISEDIWFLPISMLL